MRGDRVRVEVPIRVHVVPANGIALLGLEAQGLAIHQHPRKGEGSALHVGQPHQRGRIAVATWGNNSLYQGRKEKEEGRVRKEINR